MKLRVYPIRDALLAVDAQRDFCPGGALAVLEGHRIIPVINKLLPFFGVRVATKEWHPRDHTSFLEFGGKWPPHGVQDTEGADFHPDLHTAYFGDAIFYKGAWRMKDDYSGFAGLTIKKAGAPVTLYEYLMGVSLYGTPVDVPAVRRVFVCGLATDYCVKATVLDGLKLGFQMCVVTDAIAAVNVNPADGKAALKTMRAAGAKFCTSEEILRAFDEASR